MIPPEANNDEATYTPYGRSWNAMREQAMRGGKLTVASPLSLRNSANGTLLSFDAPIVTFITAIITGPVEDGGAGRFLGKLVDGPIDPSVTADFTPKDLGSADGDKVVEVWSLDGSSLAVDRPVMGWHVGNRGDNLSGRQILLVSGGGKDVAGFIIGNATGLGTGYYTASGVTGIAGDAPIDVSATFASASLAFAENCVFANMPEREAFDDAKLTHGGYGIGVYIGQSNEVPPRKVYAGVAFRYKDCATTGPGEGDV